MSRPSKGLSMKALSASDTDLKSMLIDTTIIDGNKSVEMKVLIDGVEEWKFEDRNGLLVVCHRNRRKSKVVKESMVEVERSKQKNKWNT